MEIKMKGENNTVLLHSLFEVDLSLKIVDHYHIQWKSKIIINLNIL